MPQQKLARAQELDEQFVDMREVYCARGGLLQGDELARRMLDRGCGDFASLAKMIVTRQVLSFDWRGACWVPMFQFNQVALTLLPAPCQVRAELPASFDGWSLAIWFATTNSWLDERLPVDVLQDDLAAVLSAARSDRWVALG